MSSYPFVMLLVAAAALVVAYVALLAVRRLHRELVAVRAELAGHRAEVADTVSSATAGLVPAARSAERTEEIRVAVAEALAYERERELAEARAFWAAQEAREAAETPLLDGLNLDGMRSPEGIDGYDRLDGGDSPGSAAYLDLPEFEVLPLLPRQHDQLGGADPDAPVVPHRRHPSDPDFTPSPVVADPEQTVARLTELAEARIPLADVRPGPLGTLDLYVFTDGTTLCLTPGHSETADRLAAALERGEAPVLLGGSGISGAYALTFTYGGESVFILADRVVASL
ncbi:hypothetical protein POF50_027065 [Streptomyces sp. SL13]|uniref:Secreted protein n=1 Tax=Streptantibioticus silvisoli TaxID=2705255 RepID=A0AA90H2N2_9ACTN|nr:hypothetical protein [Streptantibioticus silvisoli]MDI5965253.1 hypothetical protein [Streptantibioticus silvisoli]MDI5972963.1 hypothetical protein [Streptantibioticus silvisoli]